MKSKGLLKLASAILVLVLATMLIMPRLGSREEEIERFVLKHQTELETIVKDCLNGENTVKEFEGVEVEGLYGSIVQFYHSGKGLVPSSTYYGFYYSEDGSAAYCGAELPLTENADGSWSWTDGTDNGGITKKITGNWYYYEAWF